MADFGVFVELTANYVEGMISYDDMDEPYDISSGKLYITGRKSGKRLKMGDSVRIRVKKVDMVVKKGHRKKYHKGAAAGAKTGRRSSAKSSGRGAKTSSSGRGKAKSSGGSTRKQRTPRKKK